MTMKKTFALAAVTLSPLFLTPAPQAQAQAGADQLPIEAQLPAQRTLPSKNILMIVGNENRTVLYGTSIGDVFIKNRLTLDMGHEVTVMPDTVNAETMLAAANAADLVLIVESVTSGALGTKLVSTPTPILFYEAFLQDEFGLVDPSTRGVDPGTPDEGDYGAIEDQTHINIVAPEHPLAAGLQGTVQVYRFPREINWGKAKAPAAEVIAMLPDYPSAATIYLLRKGAARFDGTPSPGLRLSLFIENDNETGTANLMTRHGLRLFDAAVEYALTTDPAR